MLIKLFYRFRFNFNDKMEEIPFFWHSEIGTNLFFPSYMNENVPTVKIETLENFQISVSGFHLSGIPKWGTRVTINPNSSYPVR